MQPGIITRQIIEKIIESHLVIADLTDDNPNVLYELALRHAIRKPLVQVIQKGQLLPFDIAATRVIHVDYPDPDGMEEAKIELEKQIKAVESDPGNFDNPISTTFDLQSLRQSSNIMERQLGQMLVLLQELVSGLSSFGSEIGRIGENIRHIGYISPSEMLPLPPPSLRRMGLGFKIPRRVLREDASLQETEKKDVFVAGNEKGDKEE